MYTPWFRIVFFWLIYWSKFHASCPCCQWWQESLQRVFDSRASTIREYKKKQWMSKTQKKRARLDMYCKDSCHHQKGLVLRIVYYTRSPPSPSQSHTHTLSLSLSLSLTYSLTHTHFDTLWYNNNDPSSLSKNADNIPKATKSHTWPECHKS